MALSTVNSELLPELQQSWQADPKLQQLISKLINKDPAVSTKYSFHNNLLLRKGKLLVGFSPVN